jgi:hypothetical protein
VRRLGLLRGHKGLRRVEGLLLWLLMHRRLLLHAREAAGVRHLLLLLLLLLLLGWEALLLHRLLLRV